MARHTSRIRSIYGQKFQHGQQEACNLFALLLVKMVLFVKDVREGPVAQAMNITQLALAVEDFLRPFARETE